MLRLSAAADKLLSTSFRVTNYWGIGGVVVNPRLMFCEFRTAIPQPYNLLTLQPSNSHFPPLMTPQIKIRLVSDVFFKPTAEFVRDAVGFM